ncbi:SusC/RagA family TonB-linked outer membrane protein [Leeuwenhoekiella sp. MAR_2009_132]|uniref:SusC/RagA family TonB-linked outer membrane protein n=1 Tax=Leeuwenhoekiella sp. MAR_2009_132 TaxID=1392489 RepID=UPI00048E4697|nr:TonB-dependent receptor [Leeuwenhoekiella sp. MAR_2009_132]
MIHTINKLKHRFCLLLVVLGSLTSGSLFAANTEILGAPQNVVTGTIYDGNDKQPLIGVTVQEKGTNNGTATDFDGKYSIRVAKGATLVYSFVGFVTKEVVVGDQQTIDMTLNLSQESLEETVVIAFSGKQKKTNMVTSVVSVNPEQLKGPTNNLTNMLAGRVPGMISYQRSGEPGADNSDFFIRGLSTFGSGKRDPLILIDGIESTSTDLARLQPDDIDSFSVLKDAAAASVYGARGANGVVLITTKRGKSGKTNFSFRSQTRVSSNTKNFNFADNITYMNMANEAALTRDRQAILPYTQTKIDRTAAGDNPLLYPSNNWIDQMVKDYTVNESINISASGGSEKARYYVAGTYNIDNGILDVEPINNFNSNIKLRNYSIRSNLDIELTETTDLSLNVYGQFDDYNGPVGGRDRYNGNPVSGGTYVFNTAVWSNPVAFPAIYPQELKPLIEHPLFGGAPSQLGGNTLLFNPYAEMVKGYQTSKASTIQAQIQIKQDLGFITEGLSFRSMGYIRRYAFYEIQRQYNPFYYSSSLNPIDNSIDLSVLNDGSEGSIGQTGTEFIDVIGGSNRQNINSRIYNESQLNYNRTFAEKHTISAMLLNLIYSTENGVVGNDLQGSLPFRNHGVSGSLSYSFDDRYLTSFSFGYNGSERFAKGHRYGFFPSVGLGWRISKEKFFEPISDAVTNLKLRLTYGKAGNDQIGEDRDRFFYLSNVDSNNPFYGATFGQDFNYGRPGVLISRYPNEEIGWEESEQYNLGIDLELYKSLNLTFDIFKQKRSNILQTRSEIGSVIGLTAQPQANFAELESHGFEVALDYNKQFNNNWWTQLRATMTYATNEITQYDELNYPDNLSYLSRVGQHSSQTYGYIAERLFVDQEEVNNSPTQFGDVNGGDIKYRDVNGDGQITPLDKVPIGLPTVPEFIYGFGGSVGYKNFDLSMFFQGSARSSFFINPQRIAPFVVEGRYQNGLLNVIAEDYWSEDNRNAYAFWPRLSQTQETNNIQESTWWLRNGDFLRLKNVEFGYKAPESVLNALNIKSMRVYVSALNLAVWSSFDLWDPEMGGNGLGYPIQSVYNFGLQFDF